MKCPECASKRIDLSSMKGFSRHPVKECIDCKTVWFNDGDKNYIILKGK